MNAAPRLQAENFRQQRRQEARDRTRQLGLLATAFLAAAGFVLLLGLILGTIALVKYYRVPEAVFEVPPKEIRIPPQKPEHRMNVARHEASRPKPALTQKLISTKPTDFALPDLPQVPLDQMLPLDPSQLVSDQVSSIMGSSGLGRGLGSGLLGSGGTGQGMGFLGIKSDGQRIVLIFDISTSVLNKAANTGLSFDKIREETIKAIGALPITSRFGIIQFSRNYKPFRQDLTVATQANKDAAKEWIEKEWTDSGGLSAGARGVISPSPNGIEAVLQFAFTLDPDVIFLISDASFQRSPDDATVDHGDLEKLIDSLQKGSKVMGGCKIHFIGFGVKPEDERTMKRLIRRNKGEYKDIK